MNRGENADRFILTRTPRIVFGPSSIDRLGAITAGFGKRALLVMSRSIVRIPGLSESIVSLLSKAGVTSETIESHGEPSPEVIDSTVNRFHPTGITAVISIGGGSTIDAGKAISAMLPLHKGVTDFLEEAGTQSHPGYKIPFIAVPTTAGTGSEASANAVVSRVGANGFKKSLRHENLVPDVALVDPGLALSCPPEVTAACGMDALTQLLEAYVSPKASPMIDALVESALPRVRDCLTAAVKNGAADAAARSGMAYAALISGIALANAGLGVVHGLASPIGGLFHIPHGVVCGTLLLPAIEATISELRRTQPGSAALEKYAHAGSLLSVGHASNREQGIDALRGAIDRFTNELRIPWLSAYGITGSDVEVIIAGAGNKNNPARLNCEQIAGIVLSRL